MCQQIDNLKHYFFYCPDTKYFWNQVEKWLCNLFSISVNLTVLELIIIYMVSSLSWKSVLLSNYVKSNCTLYLNC